MSEVKITKQLFQKMQKQGSGQFEAKRVKLATDAELVDIALLNGQTTTDNETYGNKYKTNKYSKDSDGKVNRQDLASYLHNFEQYTLDTTDALEKKHDADVAEMKATFLAGVKVVADAETELGVTPKVVSPAIVPTPTEIASTMTYLKRGDVQPWQVLSGKTFTTQQSTRVYTDNNTKDGTATSSYLVGSKTINQVGTMSYVGAQNTTLSYDKLSVIPTKGYHNGQGMTSITRATYSGSRTTAINATTGVLTTSAVSGNTGVNSTLSICDGQQIAIAAGAIAPLTITSPTRAALTPATATASQVLTGQTYWRAGTRYTGTMANRGTVVTQIRVTKTVNTSLTADNTQKVIISSGYHTGSGYTWANRALFESGSDDPNYMPPTGSQGWDTNTAESTTGFKLTYATNYITWCEGLTKGGKVYAPRGVVTLTTA